MPTSVTTAGRTLHRARLYDLGTRLFGRRIRSLHRGLIELARIQPGERVLDVGCGPGRLTLEAAHVVGPTGDILGIDASAEMIDLATRKAKQAGSSAAFRVAAIEAIPSPDDQYDVVLASLMIHHLPPELQRRGLAEVLRVLRPGGRFVAADFRAMPGHGAGHVLSVLGLRRGSEHAEHLRSLAATAGFGAIRIEPGPSRAFCLLHAEKPPAPG